MSGAAPGEGLAVIVARDGIDHVLQLRLAELRSKRIFAALEIDLAPPRVLKGLRLRVEEKDAFVMPWNVPELRVYGPNR